MADFCFDGTPVLCCQLTENAENKTIATRLGKDWIRFAVFLRFLVIYKVTIDFIILVIFARRIGNFRWLYIEIGSWDPAWARLTLNLPVKITPCSLLSTKILRWNFELENWLITLSVVYLRTTRSLFSFNSTVGISIEITIGIDSTHGE